MLKVALFSPIKLTNLHLEAFGFLLFLVIEIFETYYFVVVVVAPTVVAVAEGGF